METPILPSLTEDFILGLDFLQSGGIVIDFSDKSWYYRDNPERKFLFVSAEETTQIIQCNGLQTFNP